MKAEISEIFCSLQGEGIEQGEGQIFVRFSGCNLDCAFCDEKNKEVKEDVAGEDLIGKIEAHNDFSNTVSITGGEPLLQAGFLKSILPLLKAKKFRIYLESNGTLPQELDKIIDWVDVVAMDIKLPSSTGMGSFWDEHRDFLKAAKEKKVFAKVVITNRTTAEDMEKILAVVTAVQTSVPLVLQPVTPQKGIKEPAQKSLLDFRKKMEASLSDVRIIPQLHKVWGVD